MRRRIAIVFLGIAAACGEGGPARIGPSSGEEHAGIFGPRYEIARLRVPERARVGLNDTTPSIEEIAGRCRRICFDAAGCLSSDSPSRCTAECIEELTDDTPPSCALPLLEAYVCLIDLLCNRPIDQRRSESVGACGVELGELGATPPSALPSTEFCEFPDLR
jgi:hypothetical protein